uniref:Carbohydrate kinase FGGY C-terminal domain-containing protein n=1 Tax=Lotharella globosa TaxID=91324 RepID=A0A7S3YBV3_9EUKA|mmetsp:Transcript_1973/g.3915  ORF Transcript_1973/g.3915 Transcript_1973/m.3915 type:complete len:136 (+) Transcript_1973:52-459(+)
MESIAFGTRSAFEALHNTFGDSKQDPRSLVVVGGATRSPFFMQMYADILGVPLKTLSSPDAALLSAAVVASSASGFSGGDMAETSKRFVKTGRVYTPNPRAQEEYEFFYEVWKTLYPSLQGAIHRLADHQHKMIE